MSHSGCDKPTLWLHSSRLLITAWMYERRWGWFSFFLEPFLLLFLWLWQKNGPINLSMLESDVYVYSYMLMCPCPVNSSGRWRVLLHWISQLAEPPAWTAFHPVKIFLPASSFIWLLSIPLHIPLQQVWLQLSSPEEVFLQMSWTSVWARRASCVCFCCFKRSTSDLKALFFFWQCVALLLIFSNKLMKHLCSSVNQSLWRSLRSHGLLFFLLRLLMRRTNETCRQTAAELEAVFLGCCSGDILSSCAGFWALVLRPHPHPSSVVAAARFRDCLLSCGQNETHFLVQWNSYFAAHD